MFRGQIESNRFNYSLQKYKGKDTRFTCPKCNEPQKFVRYVDEDGNCLSEDVGRCDRESKCGYHYKPNEYFIANPSARTQRNIHSNSKNSIKPIPPDFIEKEILMESIPNYEKNGFVKFLLKLFHNQKSEVEKVIRDYFIGTFKDGRTIFWQVDKNFRIRSGKLISYNEKSGKRNKRIHPTWIHTELSKSKKVKEDFNLEQCLYGEHLVTKEKAKTIAIVESEKTAIIARLFIPELIWLASGGKTNLQLEKIKNLGKRKIILYPDGDSFEHWNKITKEGKLKGIDIKISSLIEQKGSIDEKEEGKDLADYLIESKGFYSRADIIKRIYKNKNLQEKYTAMLDEKIAYIQKEDKLSFEKAESIALKTESIDKMFNELLGAKFEYYSSE